MPRTHTRSGSFSWRLADLAADNLRLREHQKAQDAALARASSALERFRLAEALSRVGHWEWNLAEDTVSWSDEIFRRYRHPVGGSAPFGYADWLSTIDPEDRGRVDSEIRRALAGADDFKLRYRLRQSDGQVLHIREDIRVFRDGDGRPVRLFGAAADISDLVLEEQRLDQARVTAERQSRAKTGLLAAASHDLRQPAQAMRLLFEVLMRRLDDPEARGVAEKLGEAIASSHRLLDNLLDFSTLQAGGFVPRVGDFPVASVLDRVTSEMATHAAAKGLEFRVRRCECLIRSDPVLLERVLRNLVSNAIRYTARGGVLVGCRHTARGLRLGVWDTGRGIPAEKVVSIFRDYSRFAECDDGHGVGLGLAIVERTVRLLGHELFLASDVGRGSCFSVMLPVAAPLCYQRRRGSQEDHPGST